MYKESDIRLTIEFAKEQLSLAEKNKATTKAILEF